HLHAAGLGVGLELTRDLEAVLLRHDDVEDGEARLVLARLLDGVFSVGGRDGLVALLAEGAEDEAKFGRAVVGHEDRVVHLSAPASRCCDRRCYGSLGARRGRMSGGRVRARPARMAWSRTRRTLPSGPAACRRI